MNLKGCMQLINNKWYFFHKGMKQPDWVGLPDGLNVEWNDVSGLMLFAYYNNLSADEIDCFSADMPFEIAFKNIDNVGFFSFKFGNMPWSDCVFSPNFYPEVPEFAPLRKGETYALNIMLIDTSVGELKSIRTIALGKDFAEHFRSWCINSLKKNISRAYYNGVVEKVFTEYPSPDILASVADIRWRRSVGEDKRRKGREEIE